MTSCNRKGAYWTPSQTTWYFVTHVENYVPSFFFLVLFKVLKRVHNFKPHESSSFKESFNNFASIEKVIKSFRRTATYRIWHSRTVLFCFNRCKYNQWPFYKLWTHHNSLHYMIHRIEVIFIAVNETLIPA